MENQVSTMTLLTGLEAIQKLNKGIEKSSSNKDKLDFGYIAIDNNTLKVHSSSLTGHQVYTKIDIESDIENLCAAFNVSQLIKALKKFDYTTGIEILANSSILFTDGKKKVELKTFYYEELNYTDFSKANSNIVNGIEFKTAFDKVKKTVSKEVARPILTGVHFKNDCIESVDGYRITQIKLSGLEYNAFAGFVIDPRGIDIIAAVAKKNKSNIEILNTQNEYQLAIKTNDFEMYLRGDIIQGEYLKTESVFGNSQEIEIEFQNKDELLKEIGFIHDMSDPTDKKNPMIIDIKDNKMNISSTVVDSKTSSSIDISCKSELKIAFNSKYVLDAMKSIENDKFTIQFISALTPMIISNDTEKYLVLPIRLQLSVESPLLQVWDG